MHLYLAANPNLGKPTRDLVEPPSALQIANEAAREILKTPDA
jgi:hypothetical protein